MEKEEELENLDSSSYEEESEEPTEKGEVKNKTLKRLEKRVIEEEVKDIKLFGKNILDSGKLKDRIIYKVVLALESGKTISFKPFKYGKIAEKTETGFDFVDNSKVKGISIKELDVVFTEILQALQKFKKIKISTTITPYLASIEYESGEVERIEYLTLNYGDMKTLQLVYPKKR